MPPGKSGCTPIATRQTSASIVSPRLSLDRDLHAVVVASVLVVFVFVRSLMPCFVSAFSSACETSVSSTGQNVRQHFDQRHLGAKGVVEIGELHPDRARADDDHALRLRLENHRFAAADDRLAVERQAPAAAAKRTPVEIRIFGAVCVSVFPSLRFTVTSPALSSDASPRM